MKKITLVLLFALSIASIGYSANIKLATVEIQKIIDESEKGQASKEKLKKEFKIKEDSLKAKETSLRQLQNQLQLGLLKASAKAEKQAEFEALQRIYTQESNEFLQAVRKAEQEQTRIILKDLKRIVEKFGKKQGYNYIVEKSIEQFILFTKNPLDDVTDKIIKEYDKL